MPLLSVVMIVRNEEHRLAPALASVKGWADEIVVVDAHSQDRTAELCREAGARVVARAFTDYADQKNFAVSQASGDWVLSLDADEAVTPALAAEIRQVCSGGDALDAYRIRRRSRMFGRWLRFSGTQHDAPVRLFRRGRGRFEQAVHEQVQVEGAMGQLRQTLEHRTYDSVSQYLERFNRYTSMEAALGPPSGPFRAGRVLARAGAFFLRQYVWQQGFRDGLAGFIFAVFSAYYVVIKRLKTYERAAA